MPNPIKVLLKYKLYSFAAFLLIYLPSQAMAGEYSQDLGLGIHFFTGAATNSLTGSYGYSVYFGAEKNRGFLRPSFNAVLQYSAGTGYVSSVSSSYSLYEADFVGGLKAFPLQAGSISPFLGADAVIGTGILKLPAIVGSVDANTLGFSYGFVISTGVSITKASTGNGFRFQGQYWYLNSTLGGTSAFNLGGFRFTLGLIF